MMLTLVIETKNKCLADLDDQIYLFFNDVKTEVSVKDEIVRVVYNIKTDSFFEFDLCVLANCVSLGNIDVLSFHLHKQEEPVCQQP